MTWPLSSQAPRADDDLAAGRDLLDHRLERLGVPEAGIDRLHVVMAVEQHMRRAGLGPVREHDGLAGRLAQRSLEAERFQIGTQPFGGAAAIGIESRIGPDRGDFEPGRQTRERAVEIGVETGENRGQLDMALTRRIAVPTWRPIEVAAERAAEVMIFSVMLCGRAPPRLPGPVFGRGALPVAVPSQPPIVSMMPPPPVVEASIAEPSGFRFLRFISSS
jgi:hypothetical protein